MVRPLVFDAKGWRFESTTILFLLQGKFAKLDWTEKDKKIAMPIE